MMGAFKRPARRKISVSLSAEAYRRLAVYTATRNAELPYALPKSKVVEDLILDCLPGDGPKEEPNG